MDSWFLTAGQEIDARLSSPRLRDLFDYWRGLAHAGVPYRAQLDPADIKLLLPHIMMVDLSPEPLQVRYRLAGTEVVRFTGFDFTGRHLDEMGIDAHSEAVILDIYRKQRDDLWPVVGVAEYALMGQRLLRTEYIACPLLDESGMPSKSIVLEDYVLTQGIDVAEVLSARLRN
jgi:hypothetical protein